MAWRSHDSKVNKFNRQRHQRRKDAFYRLHVTGGIGETHLSPVSLLLNGTYISILIVVYKLSRSTSNRQNRPTLKAVKRSSIVKKIKRNTDRIRKEKGWTKGHRDNYPGWSGKQEKRYLPRHNGCAIGIAYDNAG